MRRRILFVMGVLVLGGAPSWAQTNARLLQREMETKALQFFVDHSHPVTGQTRDKADNFAAETVDNRMASIASTGFALAVIANGAERGMISREQAYEIFEKSVTFARDHVPRRRGWFVHFYDWETGERIYDSEYSTIDTALFISGALYAARIFPNTEATRVTYELYDEMDFWDAMTDGGAQPQKRSLSMAYMEGYGYIRMQWDMYAEQKVLLLLGLGHRTKPLPPEAWLAFERDLVPIPGTNDLVMGLEEALFTHQYSEMFVDFRHFQDGFPNYFQNSKRISDYHRQLRELDHRYATLRAGFWGFSAGESPTTYLVYNALRYEGTVCIGCAVASVVYDPPVVMQDLLNWATGPYRQWIWGKYGFGDSVNVDENWYSPKVLGITVGPEYMSLANLSPETSIWKEFMQVPEISLGLRVAAMAGQGQKSVPLPKLAEPVPASMKTEVARD